MKAFHTNIIVLIALALVSLAAAKNNERSTNCQEIGWAVSDQNTMNTYITRKDSNLMNGTDTFKFLSFDIPDVLWAEDNYQYFYPIEFTGRFTTEEELRDMFATITQLGGQVIRMYVLPSGNSSYHLIYYDGQNPSSLKLQVYNSTSGNVTVGFDALFKAIYLAEKYNIRLIISLLDWWGFGFFGGLGHSGQTPTLPDIITDSSSNDYFKENILKPLMNAQNPYTNRLLKEEYSILAWESGNELGDPRGNMQKAGVCGGNIDLYVQDKLYNWTKDIGQYLKEELGIKQLFMDGAFGISQQSLGNEYIDIVNNHYYNYPCESSLNFENDINYLKKMKIVYNKPFIVGESMDTDENKVIQLVEEIYNEIDSNSNLASGFMLWSIRYRSQHKEITDQGTFEGNNGFYCHQESGGIISNFHWQGHNNQSQQKIMNALSLKAWILQQPNCKYSDDNHPGLYYTPGQYSDFSKMAFKLYVYPDNAGFSWPGVTGSNFYWVYYSASGFVYDIISIIANELDSCYPKSNNYYNFTSTDQTGYYEIVAVNNYTTSFSEIMSTPVFIQLGDKNAIQ